MDEEKELPKRRKTIDEKTDEFIQKMKRDLEAYGFDSETVRKLWEDAMEKTLTRKSTDDKEPIYG